MAEQKKYISNKTGAQLDTAIGKALNIEETLSGTAATIPSSAAVKNYVDSKSVDTVSTLSGGVVYDISEANNGTTYANLAAALNNGNNIPANIRKGGISIKFIQSSDNKYVQYFLTKDEWSDNSEDWQKMNLEDEVSQLDADIYGIQETDFSSQLLPGKSIKVGDYSIGDTVPTTPVSNSGCYCIIIPVYKGNIFKLTGTGGSGPRLWGQLDKNNVLKSLYSGSGTVSNLQVTIEYDGYFVVNFVRSGGSIIQMPQDGIVENVANLQQQLGEVPQEISDSLNESDFQRVLTRGFIAGSGTPNSSSYRLKTNMLPPKEHSIVLKSGFMFFSIVLYDNNGNYVYGWEPYNLYTRGFITEPVSRFKYSGEYKVVYSIRRVVEDTSETITTDFDTVVDSLVLNDIINKDSAVKISKDCGDVDLSLSIIGGSRIDFDNKNVGDAIGNTLNKAYSNCHLVVPCRKGDLFKITANGGQGNTVAFTDNNRIITYKYNVEYVDRVLSKPFYAPTDGYLYINSITYDYNTKELFLPKCVKISTNKASYKPVRWAALGDSITISYYSIYRTPQDEVDDIGTSVSGGFCNTYAYIAASIKNAIQDNYAKGSTGWLQGATPAPAANSCAVVDTIDFSNYDLVTFAYGINDYKAPSQILGTFSDGAVKDVSVVSCMRYCIEKVIAGNPACKIVVLTPLNARGYNRELGNESTNYAIGAQNSLGYTLQDLYDKIVEVCEYYGIEYIDWTHKSVINRKSIAKLTPDGVHPSKEAQEILGRDLAMKLLF